MPFLLSTGEKGEKECGVGAELYGVLGVGEHILLLISLFVVLLIHTKYFNILCENPFFSVAHCLSSPPSTSTQFPLHDSPDSILPELLAKTYN